MISEIMLGLLAFTLLMIVWVTCFFIFDAEILNGYFKKKLQNRLKAQDEQPN